MKLSGAYSNSKIGPPSYPEAATIARDFVKAAPERLVWGSDWPHPSLANDHKPDDALLFDLLSVWVPTKRRAIAFWCAIRKRYTDSPSLKAVSEAPGIEVGGCD